VRELVVNRVAVMSSSLPEVPNILYCGSRENTNESRDQLLRSETLEAALTRLTGVMGVIHAVDHKEHVAGRHHYVFKLECTWPKGKAKVILDSKVGSVKLRNEGYDVNIKTREKGGYSFIILSPHEVVYQVVYQHPFHSPVVLGERQAARTAHPHRRMLGDPRDPQKELDSLVFKLNRPYSPLDEFSVQKIASTHGGELARAKDMVGTILKRAILGNGNCWRYVLVKGDSARDVQLRMLFLSFGRECDGSKNGLKAVHHPPAIGRKEDESTVEICVRPSHLRLIGVLDPSTLKKTADDLAILMGQMGTVSI